MIKRDLNKEYVGAYMRLSHDDGDKIESDSITNQREYIKNFIFTNEMSIVDYYVDDGYSGTNFERPSFKRLLTDIDNGKINCVVVKDLSRFGRDYIQTGFYLERYFTEKNVRFIAINDSIDTAKQEYNILLPLTNVINEQYARDISKKIKATYSTKMKKGEYMGSFPAYGYIRNPKDRHKLIIDEYPASIVRRIFYLYLNGMSRRNIAYTLNEEGVLSPSEYKKQVYPSYYVRKVNSQISGWAHNTIKDILTRELYIGNMVQNVQVNNGFRTKKKRVDKSEYVIVEGTHEPIIEPDIFEKVQILLEKKSWQNTNLEFTYSIFQGYLRCGDCGHAMNKVKSNKNLSYCCGAYRRYGKTACSRHHILNSTLTNIVMNDLNTLIQQVNSIESIINEEIKSKEYQVKKRNITKEITLLTNELNKIEYLKKEIYEDYKEEILTKNEYLTYKDDYNKKIELTQKKLTILQENDEKSTLVLSPTLLSLKSHAEIKELTRTIITETIKEIKIYENMNIEITYLFTDEFNSLMLPYYTE